MRTASAEAPSPDEHHNTANQKPVFTDAEWARWRGIVGGNVARYTGASALVTTTDAESVGPVIWEELAEAHKLTINRRVPGATRLGEGSLLDYDIDRITAGPDKPPVINRPPPRVDFAHVEEVMNRNSHGHHA